MKFMEIVERFIIDQRRWQIMYIWFYERLNPDICKKDMKYYNQLTVG